MYKVLNLYAGLGGNRLLWEDVQVTAVEINEAVAADYQKRFPLDEVVIGDAHEYLLKNFDRFDFIWSSPPCQSHSKLTLVMKNKLQKFPDLRLYEEIIFLQNYSSGKWVVENVAGYYKPLIPPVKLGRHYFWTSDFIFDRKVKRMKNIAAATVAELQHYLGIHLEKNIYLTKGSHSPEQVLRNCVDPQLGLYMFNQVMNNPSIL